MVAIFQFLQLAQTLRHYGYLRFDACVADFPEKDCPVVVSAGNSELSLQLRLPGQQLREGSFRVTRMRCWRVTSSVSWVGMGGLLRWGPGKP
jgi:sorting nexin-17